MSACHICTRVAQRKNPLEVQTVMAQCVYPEASVGSSWRSVDLGLMHGKREAGRVFVQRLFWQQVARLGSGPSLALRDATLSVALLRRTHLDTVTGGRTFLSAAACLSLSSPAGRSIEPCCGQECPPSAGKVEPVTPVSTDGVLTP